MEKRYILFRGLLAVLDLYTDEFVKILEGEHAECLVLDASKMDEEMLRLKAFLLSPVTAVVSFNNIGLFLEFDREKSGNIWDQFRIPFFNIMMDHPFHYKEALDLAPEQMILLCMDKNHVAYAKRFFPNIRCVEFFAHAGIELPGKGYTGDAVLSDGNQEVCGKIALAKRPIDVLYAGGLSRYAAEGLVPDLGCIREFDAFLLVRDALEWLIREPELTTEYVIEQCLLDRKVALDDQRLGEVVAELRFVDSFAVSFYREQAVRALAEHGVTVTVFGAGWERCEWESPNVVFGGQIMPRQVLELMCQSKVVFNTMTWFKRGAHDRVFNGMLAGAVVVSDESEYMKAHFNDGRELRMFSLREIGGLADLVKGLLEDLPLAQKIGVHGYQAAKGHHMWKHRLERILSLDIS